MFWEHWSFTRMMLINLGINILIGQFAFRVLEWQAAAGVVIVCYFTIGIAMGLPNNTRIDDDDPDD